MAACASRNDFYQDDDDWQETDFWYNRVMAAKNPASQIANPSALALITFGLTTALLQVCAPILSDTTFHKRYRQSALRLALLPGKT